MSRKNKYLKFGARADKNLSDISNPTQALDNILNDLSTEVDAEGNSLSFSSADLLPLIGLSETGLGETLSESGQSADLIQLAGNTVQTTSTNSTLVEVEPRITIKDYIDNYKVVLGDPPWTNGGTGPNTTFIPSDRLNANTTDALNSEIKANTITPGNRYRLEGTLVNETQMNAISVTNKGSAPAVGDIFVALDPLPSDMSAYNNMDVRNVTIPNGNSGTGNANALKADEVFTTKVDATLEPTIGPVNFWTNGEFKLTGKLHPDMKNNFGGIQWEGYLTGYFDLIFRSTGFFIIEQDLINDGSNNNWEFLKGVTSETIKTFSTVTWADDEGVTRIKFSDINDWKRVCINMQIVLNSENGTVESVYKEWDASSSSYFYYAKLDISVGSTESSGTIESFLFDSLSDELDTETIKVSRPTTGKRRRIRFTVYWPALAAGLQYPTKEFSDIHAGRTLSSFYFYKNDGSTDSFGEYTFPYFNTNRASILKQDSTAKLTVKDTVSIEYTPSQKTKEVIYAYDDSSNTVPVSNIATVQLVDDGVLESTVETSKVFSSAKVGDWVVVCPGFTTNWANAGSSMYAYQILEKLTGNLRVYVSANYGTSTGIALHTAHRILLVNNTGLVGLYARTATANVTATLEKLDTGTGSMNKTCKLISKNDLVVNIGFLGGTSAYGGHDHPLRVTDLGSITDASVDVTVANHPNDSSTGYPNAYGLSAIYSSRGLVDKSASSECTGVIGVEVLQNLAASNVASANTQKVYVTSTLGVQANDIVYFVAAIKEADQANPSVTNSTKVVSTGSDGTGAFILLNNPAGGTQLTSAISAGATLVIVPNDYGTDPDKYLNREYCIIPLNTAPPFESTTLGLATPSTHPSLMVEALAFSNLVINPGASDVVEIGTQTFATADPGKYIPISYTDSNGTTAYKILLNDSTLS